MIDTNNTLGALGSKSARGKVSNPAQDTKASSAPASSPVKNESGEQVVLSQEAQNMGRLQAKVASAPDVNMEKVAAIRQAIAEGRFEFNPERIAENMLKQEDLLG